MSVKVFNSLFLTCPSFFPRFFLGCVRPGCWPASRDTICFVLSSLIPSSLFFWLLFRMERNTGDNTIQTQDSEKSPEVGRIPESGKNPVTWIPSGCWILKSKPLFSQLKKLIIMGNVLATSRSCCSIAALAQLPQLSRLSKAALSYLP